MTLLVGANIFLALNAFLLLNYKNLQMQLYITQVGAISVDCNFNGVFINGTCSCFGNYNPANSCGSCLSDYYGTNCTQFTTQCRTARCNGTGSCVGQFSGCAFDGMQSAVSNCTLCEGNFNSSTVCATCLNGYYGLMCDLSFSACAATRCNSHGNCTNRLSGCSCETGYSGSGCAIDSCSPNGHLNSNGECTCNDGYVVSKSMLECVSLKKGNSATTAIALVFTFLGAVAVAITVWYLYTNYYQKHYSRFKLKKDI